MMSPTTFVIVITIIMVIAIYLITMSPNTQSIERHPMMADNTILEYNIPDIRTKYQSRTEYKFNIHPGAPYMTLRGYPEYH